MAEVLQVPHRRGFLERKYIILQKGNSSIPFLGLPFGKWDFTGKHTHGQVSDRPAGLTLQEKENHK